MAPAPVAMDVLPAYRGFYEPARYKIALGGRSAGRSVAAFQAAIYFASRCRVKFLVLREYQVSIRESAKAQLETLINQLGLEREWSFTEAQCIHRRTGSSFGFAGLARNYTNIKSIPDIDVAIIEECETVSQESLDVLIPTVRKEGSQIWMMGNPYDKNSAVAQMFLECTTPPPHTILMRTTYLDNPYNSRELLNEAEHLMRTDYLRYRHVYLGEYLEKKNQRIIQTVVRESLTTATYQTDVVIVGVDIAREGDDSTTIAVRKGRKIISLEDFSNMDTAKLAPILGHIVKKFSPHRLNVDATGHGAWAPDALKAHGVTVDPIVFSETAWNPQKYSNKRTELYGLTRDYFDNGGTVPDDKKLIEELENSWYKLDSKGRYLLIPKAEIKRVLRRSTDRSDAVALTMYNPAGMFEITREHQMSALQAHQHTTTMLNAGSYSGTWD